MHMRNTKYCSLEVASNIDYTYPYLTITQYPLATYLKQFIKQKARINVPVHTMYEMLWSHKLFQVRIPIDREESNERKDKGITMAQ